MTLPRDGRDAQALAPSADGRRRRLVVVEGGPRPRERGAGALARLLAAFLFPALGGLLFGYDIGATSFVLVQLQDPAASGVPWSPAVAASRAMQ